MAEVSPAAQTKSELSLDTLAELNLQLKQELALAHAEIQSLRAENTILKSSQQSGRFDEKKLRNEFNTLIDVRVKEVHAVLVAEIARYDRLVTELTAELSAAIGEIQRVQDEADSHVLLIKEYATRNETLRRQLASEVKLRKRLESAQTQPHSQSQSPPLSAPSVVGGVVAQVTSAVPSTSPSPQRDVDVDVDVDGSQPQPRTEARVDSGQRYPHSHPVAAEDHKGAGSANDPQATQDQVRMISLHISLAGDGDNPEPVHLSVCWIPSVREEDGSACTSDASAADAKERAGAAPEPGPAPGEGEGEEDDHDNELHADEAPSSATANATRLGKQSSGGTHALSLSHSASGQLKRGVRGRTKKRGVHSATAPSFA